MQRLHTNYPLLYRYQRDKNDMQGSTVQPSRKELSLAVDISVNTKNGNKFLPIEETE